MIRLRCEDCGTAFFSAAARTMAERGERCSVCGGRLRLDEPRDGPHVHVGANANDDDEH